MFKILVLEKFTVPGDVRELSFKFTTPVKVVEGRQVEIYGMMNVYPGGTVIFSEVMTLPRGIPAAE